MSKVTLGKLIDIIGLLTTLIGLVGTALDELSKRKEDNHEVQETQTED